MYQQKPPTLGNQFIEDEYFRNYVRNVIPSSMIENVEKEFSKIGSLAVDEIWKEGQRAEKRNPIHRAYNAWNDRIDEIETSTSWENLKKLAIQSGIVATGYQGRKEYKEFARLVQFGKLYLFDAGSAVVTCPFAMTDGAAKLLELNGDLVKNDKRYHEAYQKLISDDPKYHFTSGQHMTEHSGSSVETATIATHIKGDEYRLDGFKWFTSAIDADIALTLARIQREDGKIDRYPSLFFYYIRDPETKQLNGIQVSKLKDKLGTKALPTAELQLCNCRAYLIGKEMRGIANISPMLSVTRLWNAVCAVSKMRRAIAISREYGNIRKINGKLLKNYVLHNQTLADMEIEYRACFLLVMEIALLMGSVEVKGKSSDFKRNHAIIRVLTPLAKLYTGKKAVSVCSEGIEMLGAQGYMEDSGLGTCALLRNSQVLPIWEGTTSVQALDIIRILKKHPEAISIFFGRVEELLATPKLNDSELENRLKERLEQLFRQLKDHAETFMKDLDNRELYAKMFSFELTYVFCAALLWREAFRQGELRLGLLACQRYLDLNANLVGKYEHCDEKIDFRIANNDDLKSKL